MSDSKPSDEMPHLDYLVAKLHGRYAIGYVAPVEDAIVAMANGHKKMVATLVMREGESIEALRRRLNAAVGEVIQEGAEPINELAARGIEFSVTRRRMPRRRPQD